MQIELFEDCIQNVLAEMNQAIVVICFQIVSPNSLASFTSALPIEVI